MVAVPATSGAASALEVVEPFCVPAKGVLVGLGSPGHIAIREIQASVCTAGCR
jgi:hypothetical protein